MAQTAPADLAVAFRSFARRLHDALRDADDTAPAQPFVAALTATVDAAATHLHVEPGADLAATGSAIAQRIEATPADDWDAATLDALRSAALTAGSQLRQIEQAVAGR
jgi:hypothetical protein